MPESPAEKQRRSGDGLGLREVASLRGLFLIGSAEVTVRNDTHFLGLREVASLRGLFLVGSAEVTVRNDTHYFGVE